MRIGGRPSPRVNDRGGSLGEVGTEGRTATDLVADAIAKCFSTTFARRAPSPAPAETLLATQRSFAVVGPVPQRPAEGTWRWFSSSGSVVFRPPARADTATSWVRPLRE